MLLSVVDEEDGLLVVDEVLVLVRLVVEAVESLVEATSDDSVRVSSSVIVVRAVVTRTVDPSLPPSRERVTPSVCERVSVSAGEAESVRSVTSAASDITESGLACD